MRLNIDILRDHLPSTFQTKRYGPQNRTCSYPRPMIYEGLDPMERGNLYLATTELLEGQQPVPGTAVVAIGTRLGRQWAQSGVEVLLITSGCTLIQLFNEVQRIYNSFDSWDEQLRTAMEEEEDFQLKTILELGCRQLERSISISDRALCNFMRATYSIQADGGVKVSIFDEPRSIDLEHGSMIREACQLERVITVPYVSAIVSDGSRYYCYNVYIMGTFSGCISIDDGGIPFRESDYPLMDYYLKYLEKGYSKYIYKYSQSNGSARLAALQKLLSHRLLTASELAFFTLEPGENWRCFWLKESSQTKAYPKEYMYAMINALMPGVGYATVVHDELMGLIRLRDDMAEETMEVFSNMVQRMGYYGGVSNPFWNLNLVPDYLRQADYAAGAGRRKEEACGGLLRLYPGVYAVGLRGGHAPGNPAQRRTSGPAHQRPGPGVGISENPGCLPEKRDEHHPHRRLPVHPPKQPHQAPGQNPAAAGQRPVQTQYAPLLPHLPGAHGAGGDVGMRN